MQKWQLQDTSGPKLLDTSGREALPVLKLLDSSGPEVFGQVWPRDKSGSETSPAPRQLHPWDKSSPETSPTQMCLDNSGPRYFDPSQLLYSAVANNSYHFWADLLIDGHLFIDSKCHSYLV